MPFNLKIVVVSKLDITLVKNIISRVSLRISRLRSNITQLLNYVTQLRLSVVLVISRLIYMLLD